MNNYMNGQMGGQMNGMGGMPIKMTRSQKVDALCALYRVNRYSENYAEVSSFNGENYARHICNLPSSMRAIAFLKKMNYTFDGMSMIDFFYCATCGKLIVDAETLSDR